MTIIVIKKIYHNIIDFLYPRGLTCILCHTETDEQELCRVCLGSIQFNIGNVCKYCGRMILSGDYLVCDNCKILDRHFDKGTSVVLYDDFIKKLMFNLKYYDKRYIALKMADMMLEKIIDLDLDIDFDCIVPVPLHRKKYKHRGFNQAELIAKQISIRTGIKLCKDLNRIKATKPLNNLSIEERQTELFEAFASNSENKGNIILIDDIFTTGTTINTCSKVLKNNGANYILIATFSVGE